MTERLNDNFFLRINDSHCDRVTFSLIADQTYLYNPSSSNLFKQLLFFDEICSLFSKLPLEKYTIVKKIMNSLTSIFFFFFNLFPGKNESICKNKNVKT